MRCRARLAVALDLLLVAVVLTGFIPTERALADEAPPAAKPPAARQPVPLKLEVVDVPPADFVDGWKYSLAPKSLAGDRYDLWLAEGWLHVRRTNDQDELGWQIVLASAVPGQAPRITTLDPGASFEVSYLDGRFFIREDIFMLRSVRQRKIDAGYFPRATALPQQAESRGAGTTLARVVPPGSTLTLSSWVLDGWFFVASGPDKERFDALVRLDHMDTGRGGYGVQMAVGGVARMFHHETQLIDDGELLVASPRLLLAVYRHQQAVEMARAKIRGQAPPAIDASAWLNVDAPLSWEQLKGKVVIVDFWGTWCGPCVKKLPEIQALTRRYAGRDLVVIGVHSQQDSKTCAEFVRQHEISFPIAIDTGQTAERFAIESWPTLFLINKQGQVALGYTSQLPPDTVIDEMLAQE